VERCARRRQGPRRGREAVEARKISKARVGDEQRVLGGGHGALGDFGRITR